MKRPARNLAYLLVGIAAVAFLCVGIVYLFYGNSNVICFGTQFPSNADVEQRAYLKFPTSAQNIEVHANGVNRKAGCTIWVKFQMDRSDSGVFKSTTYVSDLSSSAWLTGDGFDFFSGQQGWHQPPAFLAGHGIPPPGVSGINTAYEDQWIFIDTSDPQEWTVFLIVNKEWL